MKEKEEGRRKKEEGRSQPPPAPPEGGNSGRRKKEDGRFGESGQLEVRPVTLIPNLLGLSPENLSLLLSELPQLSLENLIARLPDRET